MGWAPWKVTYASDYFDQLYAYAIQMIKSGDAFVCHQVGPRGVGGRGMALPSCWRLHDGSPPQRGAAYHMRPAPALQTKAEIEESREQGTPSPWRDRSVGESAGPRVLHACLPQPADLHPAVLSQPPTPGPEHARSLPGALPRNRKERAPISGQSACHTPPPGCRLPTCLPARLPAAQRRTCGCLRTCGAACTGRGRPRCA
jgi:hypothetical protein